MKFFDYFWTLLEMFWRHLLYLFIFLFLLFLSFISTGKCEEKATLDKIHDGIKYTHYGVSLLDGYTAGKGIQNGAIEGGSFANMLMPRDRPLIIPRMALAGATAYGFEKLIDIGWKRERSKVGKVVLMATQGALIGLSCHSVSVQFKLMR